MTSNVPCKPHNLNAPKTSHGNGKNVPKDSPTKDRKSRLPFGLPIEDNNVHMKLNSNKILN